MKSNIMKKEIVKILLLTIFVILTVNSSSYNVSAKTTIKQETININVGEKEQLKVNGTNEKITWQNYDKKIISISSKGIVTGKSYGKTTLVGKSGSKYYKYIINVNSRYEFSFDEEKVTIPNDSYGYIALRVNFTKDGKPAVPPSDVTITCSNEDLYEINDYDIRYNSIIIYLIAEKSWDDVVVVDSAKIGIEVEGKKAYCKVDIVPVSSMAMEDYAAFKNSKYVWEYTNGVYIVDTRNLYDMLCLPNGGNVYIKLSTGEEYYAYILDTASDGVVLWSDQFIPKDCDDEDLNAQFISRNYDTRLFYLSDSIVATGTKNKENETLERLLECTPIYVFTGEVDPDGTKHYTLEPNHSSGTIVDMRVWTQADTISDDTRYDAYYGKKFYTENEGFILPKDYVVTDWGKDVKDMKLIK
jgi:hypothetical protein